MTTTRRTAAATGLALLVLLTGCGGDDASGANPAGTPTASGSKAKATKKPAGSKAPGKATATKKPASTTAPASTAVPDGSTAVPPGTMGTVVYYVVDDPDRGPRLAREFRRVPKTTGVVRAAVEAVLHLPPLDPDYSTMWRKTTTIRGVSIKGDVATVDLSEFVAVGASFEGRAVEQLVWSVTAVAPKVKKLKLLVNGRTPQSGHADWSAPQSRGPHHDVLTPVQISSPAHGTTVGRSLSVLGEATVFEAAVSWSVVDVATKKVLAKGFDTATAGAPGRGTWSFTTELPASASGKQVEIRAWEASAEDGRVTHLDTKVVRVR